MLQSGERETEILLGNKQLLGIFFVVAALLGIAFVGGYKVGQASNAKKTVAAATTNTSDSAASNSAVAQSGGETHSVSPGDTGVLNTDGTSSGGAQKQAEDVLGARKRKPLRAESSRDETSAAGPYSL